MRSTLSLFFALAFFQYAFSQDCATPPTGVTIPKITSCTATLKWNAVPNAVKYKVKYKTSGNGWSTPVSAGNNLSYTFTGLSASTQYMFAVNDQCSDGNKSKYKSVSGTTAACTLPTLISAVPQSATSIKINLAAACSYDSIRVQYSYNNLPFQYYATTDINNVVLNNLLPNTTYTIRFSTCKLILNNWTASIMVTTLQNTVRPNILLIVMDDSRYDTYGCNYGPSWFESPNIDRIANEGVNFKYNFVTTSYCTPGRSSMVTGLYAHHHGAIDNTSPLNDSVLTVNHVLKSNGYYTGMVGKWIASPPYPEFDFSMSGHDAYIDPVYAYQGHPIQITGHSNDIETDTSIAFIKRAKRPFFLWLGYKATHDQVIPQPAYTGLYLNNTMPVPSNDYFWPDDYPSYIPSLGFSISPDSIAHKYLLYFQCMKGIDDGIGKILDTLENMNILDSTMVIFYSDNGLLLGEHLLHTKRYAYDPSTRVPLFIRYPEWFAPQTVITDKMALNIDLTPTILEAAGIGYDSLHVDGVSLHDLYSGNADRKEMLYEYLGKSPVGGFPTILSVRSFQYKYIFSGCNSVTEEFYDLVSDPQENTNLIFKPAYAALIDTYRNKLTALKVAYGYDYVGPIQNCHIVNYFKAPAADDEDDSPSFVIAPNPSSGSFVFFNPFNEEYTADFINSLGVISFHSQIYPGENSIDGGRIAPGIYHVKMVSKSGKQSSIVVSVMQ